jgi:hypothetical protein
MPAAPATPTVLVWADAERAPLVQAVLGLMPAVRVVAVGGPRKAALVELAQHYQLHLADDLRKALLTHAADFFLHASSEGLAAADLLHLRSAGTAVLAIEPVTASLDFLPPPPAPGESIVPIISVPALRSSPAWLCAAEPHEALGAVRSASLLALAPPAAGSLFARLYDALQTLIELVGVPETIDAAVTGPLALAPADLRALTGHLTAHLRFSSAASAVIQASDRSATWSRRLAAIAVHGQLTLDDHGYTFHGPDAAPLDSASPPAATTDPARLITLQWQRLIDSGAPRLPPAPATLALLGPDPRSTLACCQAALLSCRTGQPESPATLLHLRGA